MRIAEDHDEVAYPLGPALEFLQRLWQLDHALERLSSTMEKRLGVTAQQRLILRCVGKYPGVTPGALARILHVDAGTVSAALRILAQRKFIDRHRDPRDGRRVLLGLTARGRKLDRPTRGTVEAAVEQLLATTPAKELHAGLRMVERLTALVHLEAAEGPRTKASPRPRSPRS